MNNYRFSVFKAIAALSFALLMITQTIFATGKITIASTASYTTTVTSGNNSLSNSISADGRFVAFESDAVLTSDNDTNNARDVFLKDRWSGLTIRVSKDASGNNFSQNAYSPSVAYVNANLVRVSFTVEVAQITLVKDFNPSNSLSLIQTIDVANNLPGDAYRSKISSNGNYVVFESVQQGISQIYRKDLNNLSSAPVLISCAYQTLLPNACNTYGNGNSQLPALSSDGNYVVFQSDANDITSFTDGNNYTDIFIRNVSVGTTEIVSLSSNSAQGNGPSGYSPGFTNNYAADVSDDGNYIVFLSNASNFTTLDNNSEYDVFLRNRSAGTTTYIGDRDANGVTLVLANFNPNMSANGRFVTFNRTGDLMFYDRIIGTLAKINTVTLTTPQNASGNDFPEISQNGRYISFSGYQLTYNGGNDRNIYVYDRISLAQRNTGDFDADGATDLAVYRPSNNTWYVTLSGTGGYTGATLGASGDILAPNDFDGDGITDYAVFRPSTGVWYILQSSTSTQTTVTFGQSGDIPVSADYDEDNKADVAVFRPSNGTWYLQQSSAGFTGVLFGASGDIPAVGDYDRDGKADQAVFRPSNGTWYLNRSYLGFTGVAFGAGGDIPVAADYDGDTETDVAVFRPSNGVWYLQQSNQGFTGISLGASTDKPVAGDYDNDGKADVAVWRPSNGTWYIQRSTLGYTGFIYGASTDIPVPFGN